jgi:hypothetical protein
MKEMKRRGTGFSVPDAYFATLEEQVKARLTLEELTGGANPSVFKVPEGYFNTDRTPGIAPKKGVMIRWIPWMAPIAAAASLLIMILLTTGNSTMDFEDLAWSEIEQSIEAGQIDVDYGQLIELLNTADFDIEDSYLSLSDAYIEDYLEAENLETLFDEYP